MALNIEFDFIRREIVVGGIAGSWFVHLSAALVSGLFLSTALTLVMVPVMITAPSVIGASVKRLFRGIGAFFSGLFGRFGLGRRTAVTPDGQTVEIPEDADSSGRYITREGSGLVEREENGVTVVSRQAAE